MNVLKIIGLMFKDFFNSAFFKKLWVGVFIVVVMMVLAVPGLWLIEQVYTKNSYFSYFNMEFEFTKGEETLHLLDYFELESYFELYGLYFKDIGYFLLFLLISIGIMSSVVGPIIVPLFILLIIFGIIIVILDKLSDLIYDIKMYFKNLQKRLQK